MAEWFTFDPDDEASLDRLLDAWKDAPVGNAEVCGMLLEVAREQVIAYAPAPDPDEPAPVVPTRYVYAQLKQAENLWNAGRVSSQGDFGTDGFVFMPRPLDKTIKGVIRPVDGKPDVY